MRFLNRPRVRMACLFVVVPLIGIMLGAAVAVLTGKIGSSAPATSPAIVAASPVAADPTTSTTTVTVTDTSSKIPPSTTRTTTTTIPPTQATVANGSDHCAYTDANLIWWRQTAGALGYDISAYTDACGHDPDPEWLNSLPAEDGSPTQDQTEDEPTTGSSSSSTTTTTTRSTTNSSSDPYGCDAAIEAGLPMSENPCGNVHVNASETDVEIPGQMSNPKSRWLLCNRIASPGTEVYRNYCE